MKRKVLALLLGGTMLLAACGAPAGDTTEAGADVTVQTQMEEIETETEKEPVIQTVTISATGDCTLGITQTHGYEGSFHEYYDKNGEEYFFGGVRDIFEQDDFTLVNLECVLTTSNDLVVKEWNLKGKPEYVGIMTSSSIEGCSMGNNHTQDYGPQSLEDTINAVNEAGIVYGFDDHAGVYETEEGVRIGVIGVNLLAEDEEHENYVKKGIENLKADGVEIVIAAVHWGIELDFYPTDYQQDMAHNIIDWGADLVIGNHPHVLQGVETYKGKVICYSLGNFSFGGNRNPKNKDTMIFQQTFTFVDGEMTSEIDVNIIPCRISSVDWRNDFRPTLATEEQKAAIISNVNKYSAPYSGVVFDENGVLTVNN